MLAARAQLLALLSLGGAGAAAEAGGCGAALAAVCAAARADAFGCATCAGRHAAALMAAGCSNDAIARWCAGQQPQLPPAAPSPVPGTTVAPPQCSANASALDAGLRADIVNLTDGQHPRCFASVRPRAATAPVPVLLWFHAASGHAQCDATQRMLSGFDPPHTSLPSLALTHGFALVCMEALQLVRPPPSGCAACVARTGCTPGTPPGQPHSPSMQRCQDCVAAHTATCAAACANHGAEIQGKSWFNTARRAFCDPVDVARGAGSWMIPEVMTQATGGRCAAADTVDNVYVANAMATLRDSRHPDGGAVYDMTKLFIAGCSEGGAVSAAAQFPDFSQGSL